MMPIWQLHDILPELPGLSRNKLALVPYVISNGLGIRDMFAFKEKTVKAEPEGQNAVD